MSRTKITGTVTATHENTGNQVTRKVRPFFADSEDAWTEISDRAFAIAFFNDGWLFDDEDLNEEIQVNACGGYRSPAELPRPIHKGEQS